MESIDVASQHFARHGFSTRVFADAPSVRDAFRELIAAADSVGFGGSATLRELGLDEVARASGKPFFDHWEEGLDADEIRRRRLAQGRADLFATGANAATIDGRLMLVDGVGNRVAAATFGPRVVLFVVGENKLVTGLDRAYLRIKRTAAPRRAAQLGAATPCATTGRCEDCDVPGRICRTTAVIERPSFGIATHVWLVRGAWGL